MTWINKSHRILFLVGAIVALIGFIVSKGELLHFFVILILLLFSTECFRRYREKLPLLFTPGVYVSANNQLVYRLVLGYYVLVYLGCLSFFFFYLAEG